MKFIVTKLGAVTTSTGSVWITPNREVFMGRPPARSVIAGTFSLKVKDDFNPVGTRDYDINTVTKLLKIAKDMTGKRKVPPHRRV